MAQYDVAIIGSGPGGYVSAIRCSQLGLKTALIEKYQNLGGTCLNVGCIPSKSLLDSSHHYENAVNDFGDHGIEIPGLIKVNLKKMISRKKAVVDQTISGIDFLMKKNNISVYNGLGSFIDSTHINIDGEKILHKILLDNKPVIFISGHFANFELMSMEITKKKINLATIYRPLNNYFLNPFMEYLRKKYICKNQIKKGRKGVKESIEYIKNHHSIALMIDQRVSEGKKIKFFDEKAFTTTLPAQLALKYNLDLVPIFIERENTHSFKMKVYEPIKPSNFKDKFEASEKLNQIIENMIIKNPNQWIWTHDRWK